MNRLALGLMLLLFALGLPAQDRRLRPEQAPGHPLVQPVRQEARVALVIGNAAYEGAYLKNPVNDARSMATALQACGFQVTTLTDGSKRQMEDAIRTFGDRIRGGDVGLFYFAGHGVQVKGVNYLIPVDSHLEREDEVPYQAVDAGQVLDKMDAAKNRLNILILDACRNNPFARSWRGAGDRGLAQVNAPTGTLVAYATGPGKTAADGRGDHGLYTAAILSEMRVPGQSLLSIFQQVRRTVMKASGGTQVPWESNSTLGDFFFTGPADAPGDTTEAAERPFWNAIQDSPRVSDFEVYLAKYPNGRFVEQARQRIQALRTLASTPSFSGDWIGTLKQTAPLNEFTLSLSLNRTGDQVFGTSAIRSRLGETGVMSLEGTCTSEGMVLRETRIRASNPQQKAWCLKTLNLTFDRSTGAFYGAWSGVWVDGGPCYNGTLTLHKKEGSSPRTGSD